MKVKEKDNEMTKNKDSEQESKGNNFHKESVSRLRIKGNSSGLVSMLKEVKRIVIENWESGFPGKIFLVGITIVLVWLVLPILFSAKDHTAFSSPTEVLKQYYKAFREGDVQGYLNCVNYSEEERIKEEQKVSKIFRDEKWSPFVNGLYGKIDMGVPSWNSTNKMSIKVSLENREHGGGSTKTWYLIKTERGWLVDPKMTTHPDEMGLKSYL